MGGRTRKRMDIKKIWEPESRGDSEDTTDVGDRGEGKNKID